MSHHKRIFACAIAASLLTLRAPAAETTGAESTTTTNQPAFKAKLQGGETVGAHQVQRAFLNVGTNQMAFIVPTGFWMDASNPQKVVLTEANRDCFIMFQTGGGASTGSDSSSFREQALRRFPGAKIVQESTEWAANHSGPAFTLEWLNSSGVAQTARISFIPSAAGILEFSVLARSADFKMARNYYEILLGSVQTNEGGKLVIVPLPNFS